MRICCLRNLEDADIPHREEEQMEITLEHTYLSTAARKIEIERELAVLEEILKTPERTVEDIVRHIELLKEYRSYI